MIDSTAAKIGRLMKKRENKGGVGIQDSGFREEGKKMEGKKMIREVATN
ncbi:MAG TPA: hypothetical protein VJ783_05310 [Pirellulales bacterium]|nr:hypothetical protein [Pirellulales bacterium]